MIVVTNRILCRDNFIDRIERIAQNKPQAIILREKDLTKADYYTLALKCKDICQKYNVQLIVNSHIEIARKISPFIQLSFSDFMVNRDKLKNFSAIGVSIHSLAEVMALQGSQATFMIAGHIFATDCKRDLPPKGLKFLKESCKNTKIPVYAIGGISLENIDAVLNCGAAGVCLMSQPMMCNDVALLLSTFKHYRLRNNKKSSAKIIDQYRTFIN
ncbi:MAG: thiamine phosphate synthase [Bacillota bacterium]|jgi:thiamine-phosphate pyrophosphorylase